MKTIKHYALFFSILIGSFLSRSQELVDHVTISGSFDLSSSTVLGELTLDPTTSGKVVVRFDGTCIADVGDRIILAASDAPNWLINDGHVSIEVIDGDVDKESFSHTRVYTVTAGSHTFYAVGHNYVETDGNGIAAVYGRLTAEFIPDGSDHSVDFQSVVAPSTDFSSSTTIGQVTINPTTSGKAIVHFDGTCISDVGDRIILAASDSPSWSANDGNVPAEAYDADIDRTSFSHTRSYDVTAGSHTFYAVGHNYVETDGSGIASIYGGLFVEFIPDGSDVIAEHTGIATSINDLSSATELAQLTINPSEDGKAIVTFDGYCGVSVGDRIILAASDAVSWTPDAGNIGVEAANTDQGNKNFSHTRVYDVSAGAHTFYAVGQNYVETAGSGSASFYGSLTVRFVPNATNSVSEEKLGLIQFYPNPAEDFIAIKGLEDEAQINVFTYNGQKVIETIVSNGEDIIDLSFLESGIYLIQVNTGIGTITHQFVKK